MHLLHQRAEVHHRALEEIVGGRDVVMDSSIWQDMAYADMLYDIGEMSANEYDTYKALARMIDREALRPDVCIFLEVPISECFARIQHRMTVNTERSCESSIDSAYLSKLKSCINQNILRLDINVYFPRGDYLPDTSERRLRIENLWSLVEDVCPTMMIN